MQDILAKTVELGHFVILDELINRAESLEFAITTSLSTQGTLLHQAVLNGDVSSVEKLIKVRSGLTRTQ